MILRNKFLHEKEYVKYWKKLIDLERKEEMKFHRKEIERLKGKEREKKGRAIVGLKYVKMERNEFGKFLVYLFRREIIKESEIKVGDVVLLSNGDPLKNSITATVYFLGKNSVVLYFERKPPKRFLKKTIRLDLYVNETTYRRMDEALNVVRKKRCKFPLDVLLGHREPNTFNNSGSLNFFNNSLNDVQKEAVIKAVMQEKELFLIHGPPGTGKTTTLVEIALQLAERNLKVLVAADSNTAVDNFLEKLLTYRREGVVRVGSLARVSNALLSSTLDVKVMEILDKDSILKSLDREVELKEQQLKKYVKPTPANRRGLKQEEIIALAAQSRGVRGIPLKKIKKMARYIKLKKEIDLLKEEIKKRKESAIKKVLDSASIIFATTSTAGSEILDDQEFDVVIIDEATQATEPSALIAAVKGKRLILAGDHKQLPPTILSMEAKEQGLEKSMFERFIELYPSHSIMLLIQYRMKQEIMHFANKHFYKGKLIAHPSTSYSIDMPSLLFVQVEGEEKKRKGSTSYYNKKELEKVKELVEMFLSKGFKPNQIGVISPYDDQVEMLKKSLKGYEGLEIKTVDGFQGREKEVIIISLVRANEKNKLGFLEDLRRLNVSVTRARKHLVIVGNEKTLASHEVYAQLLKYAREVEARFKT